MGTTIRQCLRACALGALLAAPVTWADDTDTASQLYTNLNVIDGTGAPLRENRAILVRDGRIEAILPMSGVDDSLASGAEVIDGQGMFALPGLIDTHVHLATSPEDEQPLVMLRRHLYSGLTSVRDMAGDVRVLAGLARDTRLDRIPGPDVYYVALMAGESFFTDPRPGSSARGAVPGQVPWMQAIDADTDMPLAVAMARGTWASAIKIYADLPAREVERITAEGHRQGMQVWAHSMVFPTMPSEVVAADVDSISHVCRLVFEAADMTPENYHHDLVPDYANIDPADPRIVSVFEDMARRGTYLDATVGIYARAQSEYDSSVHNDNDSATDDAGFTGCPTSFAAALTREALERGVPVSAGSDFVHPEDDPWPALYEELEVLNREVGMAPEEVIHATTLVGARVIGIDESTGSLEVGKRADMILLRDNPLKDLANLRSLELTIKHGQRYPRRDFVAGTNKQ